MKKYFFIATLLFLSKNIIAQNDGKVVFAFPITSYVVNSNDSISIVQVMLPDYLVTIDEKQLALLKHNFSNNKLDTNNIGYGRCNLIKGTNYYFGIKLYNKQTKPTENDLIYVRINYATKYTGQIYNMIKNAIYFTKVTDEKLYEFETALQLTQKAENVLLDSLVADIKYTGKVMQEQIPEQNKTIVGGIFNGKKLFTAMQNCTIDDVNKFLDYVTARPTKYAGNTWKISETFATWMDAGTPTVIK